MAVQTETLQMTGIRCERCVGRLASTLKDQPGLEQANANLMGQVTLAWDDEQTSRDDLLALRGIVIDYGIQDSYAWIPTWL